MRWACRNTNWQILDFRVLCWSRQALKMRAKCDQNLFGELLLSCKSKPHFVGTKVQFARTCNLYQTVMGSGVAIRLSFLQVAQPSTFGWHARKIKASHLNHHYRCRNSADFSTLSSSSSLSTRFRLECVEAYWLDTQIFKISLMSSYCHVNSNHLLLGQSQAICVHVRSWPNKLVWRDDGLRCCMRL